MIKELLELWAPDGVINNAGTKLKLVLQLVKTIMSAPGIY